MTNTSPSFIAFKRKAHKIFHDWLQSLLLISFMLIARSTLADHYLVPSGSMENTLIPEDHVLVLGDHRGNSRDGRFFGTVPVNELYGRATAVFLRESDGLLWQSL